MAQQLITFQLGDRLLGIDIMAIREIRAWAPATPLPNTAPYMRGVVNLRGVVLPVMDLRQRLGWGESHPDERHVMIVVDVNGRTTGLLVDCVNEIESMAEEDLQPIPSASHGDAAVFLQGLCTKGDRLILVLALERIVETPAQLQEAA